MWFLWSRSIYGKFVSSVMVMAVFVMFSTHLLLTLDTTKQMSCSSSKDFKEFNQRSQMEERVDRSPGS